MKWLDSAKRMRNTLSKFQTCNKVMKQEFKPWKPDCKELSKALFWLIEKVKLIKESCLRL